ncbi:pyridoxine 5'-phosphate synthase [Desulfothermus okinawensis JCM 13304]
MPKLAVNVDHIATIRQARLSKEPDPVHAAFLAEVAGANGIIVHLREDRRHIQDRDVLLLKQTVKTKLHLEMAATEEMQKIALEIRPYMVCLVPEKRQELTTEGGLDAASKIDFLKEFLKPIKEAGIKTSLFIDADEKQIEAAKKIGSQYIEIHTGHFADAKDDLSVRDELKKILKGIKLAQDLKLKVNLGHGLDYENIWAFSKVHGICEYSIGHSIVARAALVGMERAVKEMVEIIRTFVD